VNQAQQRLAELATWIGRNSASRRTPLGGRTSVGPWAVIVPADVAAAPEPDFDPKSLPIFVPAEQAEGLALPAIDTTAPDSQPSMSDRLAHLIWRLQEGTLPPAAVIGLGSPVEPLQDAIAAAGADAIDATVFPVLCVPLWALPPTEYDALSGKLPLLP
jgi:hypothetical protein